MGRVRGESASTEPRRRRACPGEDCSGDVDAELKFRRFEVQRRGTKRAAAAAEFMGGKLCPSRRAGYVV
jgi:hypothetical protein